uniref:Uncharacterized protein n=1 Tax=Rhabditophanes sp. KR3021 TaxID=114890 RepID=A0AC35TPX8_9BILA
MFRSEERICMIYANNFESWDYLKSINLDDECYDLRKWYPKLEQFEWKFTFNDTIFNYNNENQKILELLKKYCFGGKLQIIFTFYVNIPVQLKAACKIIDICKENSKNCQNIKFNIFYTATKKIPHGISVNCDSFILKTTLYRLAEYIGDTPTDKLFPNIIKIIILHNEIDNDILDKAGKELENLKELRSLVICYSQETSDKTTKEQFMEFLKKMPKLIHFLSLKETNGYFKDFGCELKLAFPNLTQLEMLGNRENVLEDFKEDYFLNFDKLEILRLECLGNYKENSENKSNRTISEQFPLSLKVLINDCDNTKSLSCYLESLSTKDSNHMDQIDQEKLTCNCLKRKDKFETLLHQNKLKEIISAINYKIATGKMDYYIEFWKNHDLSPEDISFKIYSKNSYTKNFNCFKGGELSISPKYKQYKDSSLLIKKCNDLLEWENLKESQAERDNTEKQLTYLIRQMYSDIFAILEMMYKNVLNLSKGNTNNATPKDIPYDTILRSFNIVHSFDMCKLRNRSVHELYQNNKFMQKYAVCILAKFIYVNNKPILK